MSKLCFGGYYGMSNYGDDLFGVVASLGSKKYWNAQDPSLIAPRIHGFQANYGNFGWLPIRMYERTDWLGQALRLISAADAAVKASRFIFAGGSIFHAESPGINELACRLAAGRCSAVGVSIGPFPSIKAERRVKELLKRFEYIAVRDAFSADVASQFDLEATTVLAGDLAGVVPKVLQDISTRRVPNRIGFSPCSTGANTIEVCDDFIRTIRSIRRERDVRVCVLTLNEHARIGDAELSRYVAKALAGFKVPCEVVSYQSLGIAGTWRLISSFSAYVSARLHGAVSAYAAGVPFLLVEYHRKCADFLDLIGKDLSERLGAPGLGDPLRQIISRDSELHTALPFETYAKSCMKNFTHAPWVEK